MAGHSRWKQIKHKKATTDQKRSKVFSKLLRAVVVAARKEPNPEFNPHLRTAIDHAKEANVPSDKIENAIARATESGENLEEILIEAYGPGGIAMLVTATTDNRNRTMQELKVILNEWGGKWAEPGGVLWAFEDVGSGKPSWRSRFPQSVSSSDRNKNERLVKVLEEHDDVQQVFTSLK